MAAEPAEVGDLTNNFRFSSLVKNAYLESKITTSKVAALMDIPIIESNRLAERWLSDE